MRGQFQYTALGYRVFTISSAGHLSSTRIHPIEQSKVMNPVSDKSHSSRKLLLIGIQVSIIPSPTRPAVIQDDIVISNISQPGINYCLSSVEEQRFRDLATQSIPVVLFAAC